MVYAVKYGEVNKATGAVDRVETTHGEAENALDAAQKANTFIGPGQKILLVRPLYELDW